jgi:hypothetical protein
MQPLPNFKPASCNQKNEMSSTLTNTITLLPKLIINMTANAGLRDCCGYFGMVVQVVIIFFVLFFNVIGLD